VLAAEVAAVGDRDAQAGDRAAVAVAQRFEGLVALHIHGRVYEGAAAATPAERRVRWFSLSGGGGGAHHDPGLGGGGAGFAANRADRLVELVGVAAGEPQLEVEAAGEEVDL